MLWTDAEAFLVATKGCKMLARVLKVKNSGHITCPPVPSELQVVSISSLIWMSLKADQAESVSGKCDAVFAITIIVGGGRFGQVGRERRQLEQQEGVLSKTYTYS
jgi:hypothetical protein